jgi:hypothetical protein
MVYQAVTESVVPVYRIRNVYEPTEATVLGTAMDAASYDDREVYYPLVRLQFDAGGESRKEWIGLDQTGGYHDRARAEADLRAHPVGQKLPVWYDPVHPNRAVVTRDLGSGAGVARVVGWLALLALLMGFPFIALVWRLWRASALEQTTGRVLGGEVHPVSHTGAARFQPVLRVECDHPIVPSFVVPGAGHAEPADAETELTALLAAHPVGAEQTLWIDPTGRTPPTLEPRLTFPSFLLLSVLLLFSPVLAVATGGYALGSWLWHKWHAPPDEPPTKRPVGHRVLMIVGALAVLGWLGRVIFWEDYRCYFLFREVTGEVIESRVVPCGDGHFQPEVRFWYVLDDCYVNRWAHRGWPGGRITPISQDEAEELIAPFPPGAHVPVWCNPTNPGMGVIRRYTRWYLYPLLIPALWVLVAQTRWLLRRE